MYFYRVVSILESIVRDKRFDRASFRATLRASASSALEAYLRPNFRSLSTKSPCSLIGFGYSGIVFGHLHVN